MHELINGLISNESTFGRLMTRLGIVIGANLCFVLFSLPVVTTGASLAALYHVMLKVLRGDGVLNPFKTFWKGFKSNFRQGTIAFLIFGALLIFLLMDLYICRQAGGVIGAMQYPLYALCFVLILLALFLFPTMAAFEDSLPGLLRSSLYFALKTPWKTLVIAFFDLFPLYLTYTDAQYGPLYAFIWFFFGFGALALLGAYLLLPMYRPYLYEVDDSGDFILDENGQRIKSSALPLDNPSGTQTQSLSVHEKSEEEILEEMKKLGM